jgi:hypothetical protein
MLALAPHHKWKSVTVLYSEVDDCIKNCMGIKTILTKYGFEKYLRCVLPYWKGSVSIASMEILMGHYR